MKVLESSLQHVQLQKSKQTSNPIHPQRVLLHTKRGPTPVEKDENEVQWSCWEELDRGISVAISKQIKLFCQRQLDS